MDNVNNKTLLSRLLLACLFLWVRECHAINSSTTTTTTTPSSSLLENSRMDCDPCIRRSDFVVHAIVHGTRDDVFWNVVVAAMHQGARDMGIQLHVHDLYETFDPPQMALDIMRVVGSGERVDALIVTIPSDDVHDAIRHAVQAGIPVFGFNSGYQVADELGILGFVAQHEFQAGVVAAQQFWQIWNTTNTTTDTTTTASDPTNSTNNASTPTFPTNTTQPPRLLRALFVNHQKGNHALDERRRGFQQTLELVNPNSTVEEFILVNNNNSIPASILLDSQTGCPNYDWVLAAGTVSAKAVLQVTTTSSHTTSTIIKEDECAIPQMVVATFDDYHETTSNNTNADNNNYHEALWQGHLAFTMPQQEYLQGILPVVMASLYATTGQRVIPPLETRTYLTGPIVVTKETVPSDSYATCQHEAFPICDLDVDVDPDPDESAGRMNIHGQPARCDCIDRTNIRIGGVLHGHTTDLFWDPAYLSAEQAAKDMGITLDNQRFAPEADPDILYQKMAARIQNLCQDGVHGIFVTIPESQDIIRAIQTCQQLNVPVIAINSDPAVSRQMGVMQHIGQDEYRAGYDAGIKMMEAGMIKGYCTGLQGNSGSISRCEGFVSALATRQDEGYTGTMLLAPLDRDVELRLMLEQAVGDRNETDDDAWNGVGVLVISRHLEPSLAIQKQHPGMLIGMFDVGSYADLIFSALDQGTLLFTADQQPFLQGNLPVYLLSYYAYSRQRLLDSIILTGPSFITSRPTPAQQTCETNLWEVCPLIATEEMNYLSTGWLGVGYSFVALTSLMGLVSLVWIYVHKQKKVVRASQPPFLVLLVIGAVLSCCAIVPMGMETDYRISRDPFTGNATGTNPNIERVDSACMAVYWLYAIGFSLMFSALLAKIWRVKLIYQAGLEMRRRIVGYKDVIFILVPMLLIDIVLLITWQVVSPHLWERQVILYSYDGYALESVGKCDSESGWYFLAGIVSFHIISLFYALILCWQVKFIPPEYADSNWVSLGVIMVFQISILAIPIAAMVQDETDVFYFVRACALFLQSFTVLCLVFVPKMYKTFRGDDDLPAARVSGRPSSATAAAAAAAAAGRSSVHVSGLSLDSNREMSAGFSYRPSEIEPLKSSCCNARLRSVCDACGMYVNPGNGNRLDTNACKEGKCHSLDSSCSRNDTVPMTQISDSAAEANNHVPKDEYAVADGDDSKTPVVGKETKEASTDSK